MMDEHQDAMPDAAPGNQVINPNGLKFGADGVAALTISVEEQEKACRQMAPALELLLALGKTTQDVVKQAYLGTFGTLINVCALTSAKDVIAFAEELLLPTLKRIEAAEGDIRAEIAREQAQREAAEATKH